MNTQPSTLRIDIVSDVVCPWCVIGYRQLAEALKVNGVAHDIHWHPFELNPEMPAEGQNMREHVTEKYGATKAQSDVNRASMTEAGNAVDFEFRFADDMRMHNTFNLHQLLHWADQQGRMHDLKQALFIAHFTHGQNLSDDNVLADVAADIGLNRSEAISVLSDQRFASAVRAGQKTWIDAGVQGVPAMVFNQRHIVTGAQGVENYKTILEQLAKESS